MAPVTLFLIKLFVIAICREWSDFPKGGREPETSSDGPFEPDPDSTGVGIGRKVVLFNKTYCSIHTVQSFPYPGLFNLC